MIYSKHNIFSGIAGSDNFFIVNLLSGSADILTPAEGKMVHELLDGKEIADEFRGTLEEKGYLVDG